MSRPNPWSTARRLEVSALAVAWLAVLVQAVTGVGVDFPTVPPALFILGAGIAVTALVSRWWGPAAGAVPPLVIVVGAVVAPDARQQLGDPGELDVFVGTLVVLLGTATGVVAGIVATIQNRWARPAGRRAGTDAT